MGARQLFQLFPWRGGLNTSLDPSQVPANQLTRADNIQLGPNGSKLKREGINFDWDDATSGTDDIIGGFDFWYGTGTSRTQKYLVVTEGKKIYTYTPSTGARSADLFAGTAWATTPTRASFTVINNLLIICTGSGNAPKKFDGTTVADLGGTPPAFEFTFKHQGRLMGGLVDRLHYSPPFDPETWNGVGDSGAVDVAIGDGDPRGLVGGFSFLGLAYVGKRNSLHRLVGEFPDQTTEEVTGGLGIESHESIVVIEDVDVVWASHRGFHALSSTDQFGDLKSRFLSKDIQAEFDQDFVRARRKFIKGIYISSLNSVAWAVTHEDYGTTSNNCIYLYSVEDGFSRWPNISCQALFVAADVAKDRFYLGTATGRLAQGFSGNVYDTSEAGVSTAVAMDVETGRINIDGSLVLDKAYKSVHLIHSPQGSFNITLTFTVDGYVGQAIAYTGEGGSDLLGTTFILGSSELGSSLPTAAFGFGVDGIGKTFRIRIRNSGITERVEVMGIAVSYEPVGGANEVLARDSE